MSVESKLERYLKEAEARDGEINSFIELYKDVAPNEVEGPLSGIVVSVKNNIAVRGRKLTCASNMLKNNVAVYNAAVVEKLISSGAVIIGSTNMDEFACGSDSTSGAFGPVRNPIEMERVAGGSSGGAAASVSAGFCDAALGSDTGGSVRCPAAFNNLVGFKPSYGSVSRFGLVDMAMSLDQIGPIAPNVELARKLFLAIRGVDHRDSTTTACRVDDSIDEPKVALIKEVLDSSSEEVREQFLKSISKLDYDVISIPEISEAVSIYYLNVFAEFSSAMQRYDGTRYGFAGELGEDFQEGIARIRSENLGREVKRRILLGTYITSKEYVDAWYKKALAMRQVLKKKIEEKLTEYNALICPTMPVFPWKIGEKSSPKEMYAMDIATVPASLAGLPAGSVPKGNGKFKVGVQVIAPYGRDLHCLAVMEMLESV